LTRQVRIFFSSSNQLAFLLKMGHKLKEIRETLDAIADDRNRFQLKVRLVEDEETRFTSSARETHSFVRQEEVIGRDEDKAKILKILLGSEFQENVSVFPIVGIGGLGKTTLAQLVFNDKQVQDHFQLKMWVCVSENFDLRLIMERIVRCATRNNKSPEKIGRLGIEQLQCHLRDEIDGKRYLLVLDDVWSEDRETWLSIKSLLMDGAKGSRILVTTRSKDVAMITRSDGVEPYFLGGLDEDKSWSLFKRMAFERGEEPEDSSMVAMAKQIAYKCRGVPLAIRTIGSLLYFKKPAENEWLFFKENELAKIPQKEHDILPTLKLSYNHLPSHLKHCFAYCRLFPKDHEIDVPTLIKLWIAQGFVKPLDQSRCLEDVAYEYFKDLLWRFFFQEAEGDDWGNIRSCKMQDLMHDLAALVAGKDSIIVDESVTGFNEKIRHVSLDLKFDLAQQIPTCLFQQSKVRTFLWPKQKHQIISGMYQETEEACDAIFSNLKYLRTLDLKNFDMKILPNSLGDLKHLRYLDLSCGKFKKLPSSVTKLHNLQTLILSGCQELLRLPGGTKKLVNLRHLKIDGCTNLTSMPRGLGQLTSLHTLDKFVVAETNCFGRNIGRLSELSHLNNLRGELLIGYLRDRRDVASDAKAANLKEKAHLQSLRLVWNYRNGRKTVRNERFSLDGLLRPLQYSSLVWGCINRKDIEGKVVKNNEMLLNGLQPHSNLKSLNVENFMGVRFASWLSSLVNLVQLDLSNCPKCEHLPPLHQLAFLKEIWLFQLTALEYVSEIDEDPDVLLSASSSAKVPFFCSLSKLVIANCPNLKGWFKRRRDIHDDEVIESKMDQYQSGPSFPCLSSLTIDSCPVLTSMPLFPHVESLYIRKTSFKPLEKTLLLSSLEAKGSSSSSFSSSPLSKFKHISMLLLDDVESLPNEIGNLSSLQSLQIDRCGKLVSLPEQIGELSSLETLHILECFELKSLPQGISKLSSLQSLNIVRCFSLTSLPEGISNLPSLQSFTVRECPNVESLPKGIGNIATF
ncbi:NB-ARC domain, LRR domain containing protein, partial [Trema orientale]